MLFFSGIELLNLTLILITLAAGSIIGAVAARKVKMTAMPQLVALFNGVGGGAAALIAVFVTQFALHRTAALVPRRDTKPDAEAVTFGKDLHP